MPNAGADSHADNGADPEPDRRADVVALREPHAVADAGDAGAYSCSNALADAPYGCAHLRADGRADGRADAGPDGSYLLSSKLKGSIGEGSNHSNISDRSSVKILGIRRKP